MPGASGQLVVAALILRERGSATDAARWIPRLSEKVPPGEAVRIGYFRVKVHGPEPGTDGGRVALSFACLETAPIHGGGRLTNVLSTRPLLDL